MSGPKEQPPRKLSGKRTVSNKTLESGIYARRRDSDLRHKDRGGILQSNIALRLKVLIFQPN